MCRTDLTIHAENGKAEDMIQEITLFVGRIAAGIFGAVAGAILTALAVWTLCRFTVRRQPPRPVNRMLRMLGGLAGAIAAILFLPIGYGGFGLGSGGLGLGPGGGGFKPNDARQAASLSGIDPKESQPPPRIAVVMLGGSLVRGEAFYRFDDDPTPRTLAEIQSKLRGGANADHPPGLDVVIYFEDSLAQQSAPVQRLVEWAKQAGLSVTVVTKPGHIPN
jgi:hypothetical protein